jgi:hypothetical protein
MADKYDAMTPKQLNQEIGRLLGHEPEPPYQEGCNATNPIPNFVNSADAREGMWKALDTPSKIDAFKDQLQDAWRESLREKVQSIIMYPLTAPGDVLVLAWLRAMDAATLDAGAARAGKDEQG